MRAAAAHAIVSQAVAAIIGGMGGEWVAADGLAAVSGGVLSASGKQ